VAAPGGDGIVGFQSHTELDELPESLQVGLAEHLLRPARVRNSDDRPVVRLLVHLAAVLLGQRTWARAPDAVAGQVGEQIGLGVAGQCDDRGVFCADRLRTFEQPRRRPRENVVGGVLDQRPPHVLVRVEDVDVTGSCLVRGPRDGTRHVRVLDSAEHLDELAWLDVGADLDGQLGVALDARRGV
jgi:hypothetical protein